MVAVYARVLLKAMGCRVNLALSVTIGRKRRWSHVQLRAAGGCDRGGPRVSGAFTLSNCLELIDESGCA